VQMYYIIKTKKFIDPYEAKQQQHIK